MSNYSAEAANYAAKVASFKSVASQVSSELSSIKSKLDEAKDSTLKSNALSAINQISSIIEGVIGSATGNVAKLSSKARQFDEEEGKLLAKKNKDNDSEEQKTTASVTKTNNSFNKNYRVLGGVRNA